MSLVRPENKDGLAEACLYALGTVARVDSFYVGFYEPGPQVRMQFVFDGGQVWGPDVVPFGEHGLSAHILNTDSTYRYVEDDGRLLRGGLAFGEGSSVTRDAIVTPLRDEAEHVIGLMGYLSNEPDVFDGEAVAAAEWLAAAYAVRYLWFREYFRRVDHAAVQAPGPELNLDDVLLGVEQKLTQALGRISNLMQEPAPEPTDLRFVQARSSEALALVQSFHDHSPPTGTDLSVLSAREREIADLVRRQLTNTQIAQRLHVTERTVKGHMTRIFTKLGISDRSQI